jgi:hypothetical protein
MVFYNDILFTKKECDSIKEMVTHWEVAGFEIQDDNGRRKIYNSSKRKSLVCEIFFNKDHFVYNKVNQIIKPMGYELNCDSFFASILKYELGSFLYRHHDRDNDRFLCISTQLSDDTEYDGGNFIYYPNNTPTAASKDIGNTIVFHPDLHHEVSMITFGERKCLIIWLALHQLKKIKKSSIL